MASADEPNCDDSNAMGLDPFCQKLKLLNQCNLDPPSIDSFYLLGDAHHTNTECKLPECKYLNNLCAAFKQYHDDVTITSKETNIDTAELFAKYDIVTILNDYNHLLFVHSNEFEEIYNTFCKQSIVSCDLSNCIMMKRNYRNRSVITETENLLNSIYFNIDPVTQQILDSIHCYFLHTFDIGYKFTKIETDSIINDEIKHNDHDINSIGHDKNVQKINQLVHSKRKSYENINGLSRLSNINEKYMIHPQSIKTDVFSYGYRYFYWEYYRNNPNIADPAHNTYDEEDSEEQQISPANAGSTLSDWYIAKKYKNFKTEMLCNDICGIGRMQWDGLVATAIAHLKTDLVRMFKCPRIVSAKYYEMKEQDRMEQAHLVAMKVYCDFDTLQRKFTETFRLIDEDESVQDMKKRHENYYFLGRLLRECVEGFGWNKIYGADIRLYHGLNKRFTYSSLYAFVKGPLSTTKEYSVAVNFCNNEGIIMDLELHRSDWVLHKYESTAAAATQCCMDMSWISAYKNEQEMFVVGGLYHFYFNTIIDVTSSINYVCYIKAIKQMTFNTDVLVHRKNYNAKAGNDDEIQLMYRLLTNELHQYYPNDEKYPEWRECPLYIQNLLHSHCQSIKRISFSKINNKFCDKLQTLMFRHKNGWIIIGVIMTLFPNNELISVQMATDSFFDPSIFNSILEFLENDGDSTSLKRIIVLFKLRSNSKDEVTKITSYAKQFEDKLLKLNWEIRSQLKKDVNRIGDDTDPELDQFKIDELYLRVSKK